MKRTISLFMAVLVIFTSFTMAFQTAFGAWYPPELCPHTASDPTHPRYDASRYWVDGGCVNCATICEHPEEYREYYCETGDTYYGHYAWEDGVHYRLYTCIRCGMTECIEDKGTRCTVEYSISLDSMCHDAVCKVCGYAEKYQCEYKTYTKKTSSDKTHTTYKKCAVCGRKSDDSEKKVKHTYKDNKCTKCGFKRVVPGTVKVKSAKCSAKGTKKTYKANGEKYYHYTYKIALNLSSSNAVKYIVSVNENPDKKVDRDNRQVFSKSKFTFTYKGKKNKKPTKVTLYITPVSKTGTYGKTVKKTVTLKN